MIKKYNKTILFFILILFIGVMSFSFYLIKNFKNINSKIYDVLPEKNLLLFSHFDNSNCENPKICNTIKSIENSFLGFPIDGFLEKYFVIYKNETSQKEEKIFVLKTNQNKKTKEFLKNIKDSRPIEIKSKNGVSIFEIKEPKVFYIFSFRGFLFSTENYDFIDQILQNDKITSLENNQNFMNHFSENKNNNYFIYFSEDINTNNIPNQFKLLIRFLGDFSIYGNLKNQDLIMSLKNKNDKENIINHSIINYIPSNDIDIFIFVNQLSQKFKNAMNYIKKSDLAFYTNIQKQISENISKNLGNNIFLEKDIIPLLDNNVAFAFYKNGGFLFVIENPSLQLITAKQNKFFASLENLFMDKISKIQTYEIEGESIEEISICKDCLKENKENINDFDVKYLSMENNETSLLLAKKDNIFVITNSKKLLFDFSSNIKNDNKLFLKDIKNKSEIIMIDSTYLQLLFKGEIDMKQYLDKILIYK